jgi:predicted MFS family arabinose efflux permease
MGAAELAGLSTTLTGGTLDRGRHRTVFLGALGLVTVSSLVALIGTVWAFALTVVLLILGVSNLTVAGLALIGDRVDFSARGRAVGTYETSWALSLLAVAPLLAILIDRFGWRAAYLALAGTTALGMLVVARWVPTPPDAGSLRRRSDAASERAAPLPRAAWAALTSAALISASGLSVFVISGAWLEERFALATGGLGAVATAIGAVELASSGSVALAADRLGKRRAVAAGGLVLLAGAGVMWFADRADGDSASVIAVAVIGLLLLIMGFEFGFVSSLSLMTEAAPEARGRAIAAGNAIGTIARALALASSGQLFEWFGVSGPLVFSTIAMVGGLGCLILSRR